MSSSPVTAGIRNGSAGIVAQAILLLSLLGGGCGGGGDSPAGADGGAADLPIEMIVDAAAESDLPTDVVSDSASPEPDAGPASPVQGRWWNRTVSVEGMGERPIDLNAGRVGVWTGRGAQRRWLPGT